MKKMENIQKKKQMVIPGNLPSQLHVLDSSQQLYAPLFLASYSSSTHTLFPKTLQKPPLSLCLLKSVIYPLFPLFLSVSVLPFRKPPLFPGFASPTISATTTFSAHSFCNHLFCPTPYAATFRPVGPPSRKFLHVSKSYCSFKKRGWFLMATKDVTRGPLG